MFRLNLYFIGSIHFIHPSPKGTNVLFIFPLYQRISKNSKITCIILKKRTKNTAYIPISKARGFTLLFDNKNTKLNNGVRLFNYPIRYMKKKKATSVIEESHSNLNNHFFIFLKILIKNTINEINNTKIII
jgi:hypothetical protein